MAQILTHHAHVQPLARFTDFVEVISVGELEVILEDNELMAQVEQEELMVILENNELMAVVEQDELVIVIEQPELEC